METGKVVLVGAGPGDPGLLTIKGKGMLEAADVLVYDRLVCEDILEYAPKAKKIDVGKRQGHHPVPQEEINALLLREAAAGGLVVRLKGGDPYLFGRGAEEAGALARHGVPFEVVPGITSALAAPAYAGIPATLRGRSRSVHIVTGHAQQGETLDIDFDALRRTGGTLVFLMAVASMAAITAGLLGAGMAPATPAAVVENGTLPGQRRVSGTLETIAGRAKAERIQSPAILVVGGVCEAAPTLDWFSALPLFGKRVLVTRPKERAGSLCERLRALGAEVVSLPCIHTRPVNGPQAQQALQRLDRYGWLLLTSPQGVACLLSCLQNMGRDARLLAPVKIAALGAGTASALEENGIRADYMPGHYDAKHLANGLLPLLRPGERVLLLRAKNGTLELPATLERHAVAYEDIPLYETQPLNSLSGSAAGLLQNGGFDYITFTSASTVAGFAACCPDIDTQSFTAVCIGDASEAAAEERGYHTITARNATIDCLIDAILEEESHA